MAIYRKVFVCLYWISAVTVNAAAVTNEKQELYAKDAFVVDVLCSLANLDFGLPESLIKCATMCTSSETCMSFFYNKQDNVCQGSQVLISTVAGCDQSAGALYFRMTGSAIPTTAPPPQFGSMCSSDAECSNPYFACLEGECSCLAGYSYFKGSDTCVTNCIEYGSTYIEYLDMNLDVTHTQEYSGVTQAQCAAHCTNSSTCRSFNYAFIYGRICRLKSVTPYTYPLAFKTAAGIDYYMRNCA